MPDNHGRPDAALHFDHGTLARSLRRCREIVTDCRSKLIAPGDEQSPDHKRASEPTDANG
ncbi:hypothetical protein [Sphingomonas sp.]|uniref:hypothetical protein n=1 Tax=Sphingomonas sp. TaxID=28214 RepID=UPI00286E9C1B|nr:hypothetical protein [Sphingomonas sp.]